MKVCIWTATDISKLSTAALASNFSSLNQEVSEYLKPFQHNFVILVFYELTAYSVPSFAYYEGIFEAVQGTIVTTARLFAYISTVISRLRADVSEKVDNHRQNLYIGSFSSFHLVSFAQVVHQIKACVQHWCPEEVTILSLSLHTNEDMSSNVFQRKGTVEVSIPCLSQLLTSVSAQLFSKPINSVMGTIHDYSS